MSKIILNFGDKEPLTPPAFPSEEEFKEAHKKCLEWEQTDEGKKYIEISRQQQEN